MILGWFGDEIWDHLKAYALPPTSSRDGGGGGGGGVGGMGGIERNCADVVRNGGGKKPAPGPPERVDRSWQRRKEAGCCWLS